MAKKFLQINSLIMYFCLFFINGFMYYFFGNYFNLIFLVILVIVPFVTYIMGRLLIKYVQISITGAALVDSRDEEFSLTVSLSNSSLLFSNNCLLKINISNSLFSEEHNHILNLPVSPMSSVSTVYPLKSNHCGIICLSIPEIEVFDLLNIFSFTKKCNITYEIPVFPDAYSFDTFENVDFSQGYNELSDSTAKGYDTSEVSDIREYIPGDKLQDIHWKLSAKKDMLIIKEHTNLSSYQLIFYIDLFVNDINNLDILLDFAYGIGIKLCNELVPFSFVWYSEYKKMFITKLIQDKNSLHNIILELLYESALSSRVLPPKETNYIILGEDYVTKKK